MTTNEYLELTAKQDEVLLAPFPERRSQLIPRAIIAHGATGAGKRLAVLASLINWATAVRRDNDFIVVVPTTFAIRDTIEKMKEITKALGLTGGVQTEELHQWVKIGSNRFHLYPYIFDYGGHTRYLGDVAFRNIIIGGVAFLAATRYSSLFIENVMQQMPDGQPCIWASVDAGDSDNYWYEQYIGKDKISGVVLIHFVLKDVNDNPGVSDRWKEYMLKRAKEDDATSEFISAVTGHWSAGKGSILSGLRDDGLAQQDIEEQLVYRERLRVARSSLASAGPSLIEALEELSFDAVFERKPPYPVLGYNEGPALLESLQESLRVESREMQEAVLLLVEKASEMSSGAEVRES